MKVREDRWEQGSHFHYTNEFQGNNTSPWREARFYYSGSPAIKDLLDFLLPARLGRVWLPSYYCGEVLRSWLIAGYQCCYYDGNPVNGFSIPYSEIASGDVFISNCYFGVDILKSEQIDRIRRTGAVVVEDHSQDPYSDLAFASNADYAAASLRKSLPLPDGGVLWSPKELPLPQTDLVETPVSALRLGGMIAKRMYLRGDFDHKDVFREWFNSSELDFTSAELRGMTAYSMDTLQGFDVAAWRQQRSDNHRMLSEAIFRPDIKVVHRDLSDKSPSGLVMLLPTHKFREELRTHLIAHSIYPVVYWPYIPEVPAEDALQARDFLDRMLFVHTDARYDANDMERVAKIIASAPIDGENCLSSGEVKNDL